jgi:hypothetical protein
MSCLADPRIEALQEHADANGELSFPAGPDCFRINLRDENIQLWQETFEQIISPANLLLACADNEGDLCRYNAYLGRGVRNPWHQHRFRN